MDYRGRKAAFYTLGCKLNFSETSSIARCFEEQGFERVEFHDRADVYVINSCSVTAEGDKKSRNIIRQAIRKNPGAMVVVTGCYAQLAAEKIKAIDGVDLIVGSEDKLRFMKCWAIFRKRQRLRFMSDSRKKSKVIFTRFRLAIVPGVF
jgi:threonylcarbamoyladenosine tRNA methylthiotransferase MtaB